MVVATSTQVIRHGTNFHISSPALLPRQVQVAGLTSVFVSLTIELKPRRRNKRSVLYDLTSEFDKAAGRAQGSWNRLEARHIHMLLQNELFINVATVHNQDGELRGQIKALFYNGLEAPRHGKERNEKAIKNVLLNRPNLREELVKLPPIQRPDQNTLILSAAILLYLTFHCLV